jgi:hypothetical protein
MSSSKALGRSAAVIGALAVLAVPAAVAFAQLMSDITLLHSLYVATPISLVLGSIALLLARRARLAAARSVTGGSSVRLGRVAAWAGLYVGVVAAVALGVYAVLVHAQ